MTNREYFLASEKEDALSKKTFASVRISFSKRLSNVNYYQFTPLLREKSNFNIKEHNEKVMMLKKTLRTNTNKIFIHQPSVHSFCDVMMGKNNIDEYEFSDNKMMIMKELNTLKSCPCPDILIVDSQSKNVACIFELKIDLGYLDKSWCRQSEGVFKSLLKASKVSFDHFENNCEINFLPHTRRAIVILTSDNHSERINPFRKSNNHKVYLLTEQHPNDKDFDENLLGSKIEQDDWKSLENFVKSINK